MKFLGFVEKAIADFGKDGFAVSSSVSLLYILNNLTCIVLQFYNVFHQANLYFIRFVLTHKNIGSLSLSLYIFPGSFEINI